MFDVSAFGTGVTIVALQTFPMGFQLSSFADDKDPLTIQDDEVGGFEPLYDGSLFCFTKANPIKVTVSVIPGSDDDINLKVLLGAKRVKKKIDIIPDVTSMVVSYPKAGYVVFSNGSIISGPPADSISAGRRRGNSYTFVFGSVNGLQTPLQALSGIVQGALDFL